jgi:PAS domain S-box-containing protein
VRWPFRPFLDASPEPAWVVDTEGRIVEANAAAVHLFGRPLVDGLVMPELAEATLRACEAAVAIHWAERCETRQGLRELGGWMAPWREGESPRGCLCVARDLTALRELELRAQANDRLVRAVIDEIPDPIVVKDERGDFLLANRACAKLYGTTPEAMVGKHDDDFGVPKPIADGFRESVLRVMSTGVTEVIQEDSRDAVTGEIRHYRSIKRPYLDSQGKNRLLVVAQDVTDIVRSQRRLEESERRLQAVLEITHEGLWDWHVPSGRVVHNEQWYALSGLEGAGPERDTLASFERLLHPDDAPLVRERLEKMLSGAEPLYRSEHRLLTSRGEIWVMDRGRVAERDAQGNVVHVVGACLDITAERRASEALVTARAAAEASSIAKSRFLATMSHELRTPLNGILGMAQVLLAGQRDDETTDAARIISSSGRVLLTVLNDVLDLAKVEAGKLALEREVFEPALLVEEVQKLFAQSAQEAGLRLVSRAEALAGATFMGDSTRVRQMLCNLVSNALKFTTAGRIEVLVEAQQGQLEFSVTDTGPGIDETQQARLFQPFTQVASGPARHHGGAGLGLSIVRRLAEAMGGTAGVRSRVGLGSRFWFRLPLERVEPKKSPSPPVVVPLAPGLRVLAAEDNATNRKVISRLLEKLGVEVETVDDGLLAVARLVSGARPDLVLMDCHMPGLDGLEATAQLRAHEAQQGLARLPIVALTASAYEEDRQRCLDAGMDDFLAKPVNLEALRGVLERWVKRS